MQLVATEKGGYTMGEELSLSLDEVEHYNGVAHFWVGIQQKIRCWKVDFIKVDA